MRHRVEHRKLGRPTDQRLALLKNQVTSLFRHEKIETTVAKAKETSRLAERMITLAKRGDVAARREVSKLIRDQDVVRHLFGNIAPRYEERKGGYTRITRAGLRQGDGAQLAVLELSD